MRWRWNVAAALLSSQLSVAQLLEGDRARLRVGRTASCESEEEGEKSAECKAEAVEKSRGGAGREVCGAEQCRRCWPCAMAAAAAQAAV